MRARVASRIGRKPETSYTPGRWSEALVTCAFPRRASGPAREDTVQRVLHAPLRGAAPGVGDPRPGHEAALLKAREVEAREGREFLVRRPDLEVLGAQREHAGGAHLQPTVPEDARRGRAPERTTGP